MLRNPKESLIRLYNLKKNPKEFLGKDASGNGKCCSWQRYDQLTRHVRYYSRNIDVIIA